MGEGVMIDQEKRVQEIFKQSRKLEEKQKQLDIKMDNLSQQFQIINRD